MPDPAPAPASPHRSRPFLAAPAELGRGARLLAVVGPALVVAALAAAVLLSAARYREARDWVSHTRDVLAATQAVLSAAQDAETGQRGYLLTGDAAYLAPYAAARPTIAADTQRLRTLTRDNAAQQRRLDTLGTLVRAKFAELDATIRLRRAGRADDAVAVVRDNEGKRLMDALRGQLAAVAAAEEALLTRRNAGERRAAEATIVVVVVGALVAALLAFLTNGLLAGSAARLARQGRELAAQANDLAVANEQLEEQAAELEIQAVQLQAQQTELETTNAQLQQQAAELETQAAELETQAEELATSNEALTQANEELTAASQAKSQFLSTMSHELRTPLNGIGGYAQLLELGIHGPVTEAQRTALGRITRAQQHLLALINDILNLSRIEAGRVEYDVGEVPLAETLGDVLSMVEPQLAAKRIGLTNALTNGAAPPRVWADRDRLRQVLLNLLGNAAKFTPEGGAVSVDVAERPGRPDLLVLTVRDTGFGIPPEKLASIFEPFVQLHRDRVGANAIGGQGTGLGLAISRDLMRGMGGDVEVRSAVGAGSTFAVVLRRVVSATGEATDRRAGDERREGEERRGEERREGDDGGPPPPGRR